MKFKVGDKVWLVTKPRDPLDVEVHCATVTFAFPFGDFVVSYEGLTDQTGLIVVARRLFQTAEKAYAKAEKRLNKHREEYTKEFNERESKFFAAEAKILDEIKRIREEGT